MFESRTERRGFPGGLRAQLLAGLLVLVVGTMGLVALVGSHLARRSVERTELKRTSAVARQLAELRGSGALPDLFESLRATDDLAFAEVRGDRTRSLGNLPGTGPDRLFEELGPSSRESPALATRRLEGTPYAVAAIRPAEADWEVVVARSLEGAYRQIAQSRRLLLAYLGIDALFILIFGYAFFTYLVVRPIRAIRVATERAARGDLASPIEVLPPNEFGTVGRSFNHMLDELRENRRELRDKIDELDAAYTELEETQDSLIRSEKLASVGQLAAGVAHEIGNPLSAVSGYLDMLEDGDLDDEERRDVARRMRNQIDRIQSIVRDLLDFAREEDDDEPVGPVDVAECIDDAIDLLEPQPRTRQVEFDVDLPDDLPSVRGVDDEIVQVLVNLLINAADAIDTADAERGRVSITADVDARTVEMAVSDDGPGIPEEDRQKIFDPFFTTKPPGEGTGLGLAISHRIMERYGGHIDVESTVGEGTTFRLGFPRADRDAPPED